MTYQNGAPAHSIGVPTPRVIVESVDVVPTPRVIAESVDVHPPRVVIVVPTPWCNDSCRNSMRGAGQYALFRVSVLWWAASSCRHRWFKPWGGGLLVSLSLAQTVVVGTLLVSQLHAGRRSGAQS